MRGWLGLVVAAPFVFSVTARMQGRRNQEIYSIDVEGGQSTLFVAPLGESLLASRAGADGCTAIVRPVAVE